MPDKAAQTPLPPALAAERRFLTVDGIRVHCLVAGSGPAVVLLHGLGASAASWRENIGPLAQGHTVYALDLPGHGDSDKPAMDYSLRRATPFLNAFLDTVGVQQAAFIGNSMGGLMALALALDSPQRVNRLVLVDSAGLGKEIIWFVRLASVPVVGELLERGGPAGTRALLKALFYDRRFVTEEMVAELARTRGSPGAKQAVLDTIRRGVSFTGMRKHTILLHRLPELKVPLLVLWGAQDRVIPVAHAHAAQRVLPAAKVHVFQECGHWPQIEKAQEFNRLVLDFLDNG